MDFLNRISDLLRRVLSLPTSQLARKVNRANEIREKFGDDYIADDLTCIMGIDHRFTPHLAERFRGRTVLEVGTGAGFMTIALAKTAARVITVDIDPKHQAQAKRNIEKAGLSGSVTFVCGDITDQSLLAELPSFDAAFLDPAWAVTGPDHVFRFVNSNTQPPADTLLKTFLDLTQNVALMLSPLLDKQEFAGLPPHECQKLYLGESHELYGLYFGDLAVSFEDTSFRASR